MFADLGEDLHSPWIVAFPNQTGVLPNPEVLQDPAEKAFLVGDRDWMFFGERGGPAQAIFTNTTDSYAEVTFIQDWRVAVASPVPELGEGLRLEALTTRGKAKLRAIS